MVKKDVLVLALAVFSGFMGGVAFTEIRASGAEVPTVIQAQRFELLDESGTPISSWGRNQTGEVVLTFTGSDDVELIKFGVHSGKLPFLRFFGTDGKRRVSLWLGKYEKPTFAMSDETWEGRVLFGFLRTHTASPEDDNWGLVFRPPTHAQALADIGMIKNLEDGTLSGVLSVRAATGKSWSAP